MNILLISHYAGAPQYGMEFRSYYMAREWVRQGHHVTIVGASYSHLRHKQPPLGEENLEGIRYLWLPTSTYQGNGLARVRTMFQFVIQVFRRSRELADILNTPRTDTEVSTEKNIQNLKTSQSENLKNLVIASSVYTFDIYPCRRIARLAHAKLIYEVHDLWPLSPMIIGGYSKWHPFIWLLQRGENYAYRHCDMVVSIIDKSLPHMQRHGLTPDRFCCIPNGYLPQEWEQLDTLTLPQQHLHAIHTLRQQNKTLIGFAGGHTQSTAMHILIQAAKTLQSRTDLTFILVGDGPQKAQLIQLTQDLHLSNVTFLPPIPKDTIPLLLTQFDICYAGGVHSLLHQYGTSFNKITDYMLAAKPIIFSVDEPDSLVQRVGCGLQVEAENTAQVAQAILQLADLTPQQRDAMGTKGRNYATQNLQYPILAKQFLQSCNQ